MVTERDYGLAAAKLYRYRVPDYLDWLHSAIVEYYEQQPAIRDGYHLANWLALVAWRRWYDDRRRDQKRVPLPANVEAPSDEPIEIDWTAVRGVLTEPQAVVFDLWCAGLTGRETALALDVTPQAVSQMRIKVRAKVGEIDAFR